MFRKSQKAMLPQSPEAALSNDRDLTVTTESVTVSETATPPPTLSPKPPTKRSLVLDLLRREDGATLPELCTATGWQAHSVRAVLTGLRKQGLVLEKSIRNSATCYQILDASDA